MKLHKDVTNKRTIDTFATLEERFNAAEEEDNYSKSVYLNSRTKIIIGLRK